MKQTIIRINDISDIDRSKITVYDLNNRYIDAQGNIFRLKIDQFTKKIEIIKILRSNPEEAHFIKNKIMQKKIGETKSQFEVDPFADTEETTADESINPDELLKKIIALMSLHTERLKGITMNIKNCRLLDKMGRPDRQDIAATDDILKNIDFEGIQQIAKVEEYIKELTSYPKHINYYQAKMDSKIRNIFNKLELNNQKAMKYITIYEMHSSFKLLYAKLWALLQNITRFLDKNSEILQDNFDPRQKRSFDDASISIETTKTEIKDVEKDLAKLQTFLYAPTL